jgi:ADP-ribose pyrophosphatase YjhB (NUDIX family)
MSVAFPGPCIFISMYIKIYFNTKPLFLCDAIEKTIEHFVHHDDAVFIDELNPRTVKTMIHEMQQAHVHAGVFYHPRFEELKKAVQKKFNVVQAAGGLVKNGADKILMIFRRGRWDLPKGKLDKNEKLEDCSIREVEEETGLKEVKLHSPLLVTYHTYHEGTKYILKESHWFSMHVSGEQKLIPQTEEDIFDIRWIAQEEIKSYLSQTFPLVSDIMEAAKQKGFISF